METVKTPEKLIGAAYLFFLENEIDAVSGLQEYIADTYSPRLSGEIFELDLDLEVLSESYLSKGLPTRRLDVRKQSLQNVAAVSLINFILDDDEPDWKELIGFLDGCQATLEGLGIDVLGSAVLGIGNPAEPANGLEIYQEAAGERLERATAKLGGSTIHQFLGDLKRQFFFIEDAGNEELPHLLNEKFPAITWAMQRLTREMSFFQDRFKILLPEKEKSDDDLSRLFHQKIGLAHGDDSAQVLEDQISRLSSMYSVMATDLHLVTDAVNTFDKDLTFLEGRAGEFGADDENAFPRHRLRVFYDFLKELKKREADFRLSLDNTKAAIDIVQTQAEILRGSQGLAIQEQTRELLNQNVVLQDERASLQAAAAVVELVVVFYYTLVSWKTVAVHDTVEALPSVVKFGVVALFSASVVALTHYIGASLHKKKMKWVPVLISAVLVLGSLAAMALLPGAGAHE